MEKKDADFSWREYVHSHNSELLGAYGNFVNRTLAFIEKYCDGVIPQGSNNLELDNQIDRLLRLIDKIEVGEVHIEDGQEVKGYQDTL